jgi:predicted PurR-regulated permease PerM
MANRPEVPVALTNTLLGAALLLVVLLLLVAGWFLARQRLLAFTVAVVAVLLGIALVVRLRELLVLVVLAAVLAFILEGPVQRLERRVPRWLAIVTVYVGFAAALGLGAVLIVPQLVAQAHNLMQDVPGYTEVLKRNSDRILKWYADSPPTVHAAVDKAVEAARTHSESVLAGAAAALVGIFGWFVKGILILVMSIYMLTDKDRLRASVFRITPESIRDEVESTLREIGAAIGSYLRAQVMVILFVAVSVTVVLLIGGIPHALFIGLAAGVLEVIPYFGAFAGAIPAVALGFTKSWAHGTGLILAFIAINQFEGHVVIPLVVGHHLEMRPLWILVSLLAGHLLFGVPGMILAVPSVSIIRIIIPRLYRLYQALHAHEQSGGTIAA